MVGGGGSHDVDWQRSEFFLKGWVPPLWGMSPHRGVKKKILIYCENDRLGAGKQQRTHVAMLIGWG